MTGYPWTPPAYGHNTSTGDGVKGRGNPGVYGFSYHAAGVRRKSNQGVGVKGESVDKYGVAGISGSDAGVNGESDSGYGLKAKRLAFLPWPSAVR